MSAANEGVTSRRNRILVLLPLIAFIALAALFLYRLGAGDPSRLPSALIGHPVPTFDLPAIPGLERDGKPIPGLSNATFQGAVTLLNVWASWCVPCHDEAPFLEQLSRDKRIQLVGIARLLGEDARHTFAGDGKGRLKRFITGDLAADVGVEAAQPGP